MRTLRDDGTGASGRLDDPAALAAGDPGGMLRLVESFPDQLRERPPEAEPTPLPEAPGRPLWVAAMGGSAFAGEMLAVALQPAGVPAAVIRGYTLPPTAAPGEWLVAISYSGDTEETLAVFEAAEARGLPRVAVTSGGRLAALARAAGVPLFTVRPGLPPRAAAGVLYAAASEAGRRLSGTAIPEPERLADHLSGCRARWGRDVPLAENGAKQLARDLHQRLPVIYAAAGAPEAALLRWRSQINENAKALCHTAAVPEMNHNEVVGWSGTDPWTGQALVLLLREGSEDRRTARRLAVTGEWLRRRGLPVREVEADGGTPAERLWWLCHLADYTSVYLALLRGVDPTPVAAIVELKKRLAEDHS